MTDQTSASSERTIVPHHQVIGEAVTLEVPAANVGMRVLSGLVDYGLLSVGVMGSFLTWTAVHDMDASHMSDARQMTEISLIMFAWMVAIPVGVEYLSHGRSPGRLITGSRVVRDDGGVVRFRHCLVRGLVAFVEIWIFLGSIATIVCAASRRGKRIGDHLAGTYVIAERSGAMNAPPLLMPAELASWAAKADIRSLPGELALGGRTFLQRASSMDPAARARLGGELAHRVSSFVSPPPPPETHPERFLAAVLCERRDRELAMARLDASIESQELRRVEDLPFGLTYS